MAVEKGAAALGTTMERASRRETVGGVPILSAFQCGLMILTIKRSLKVRGFGGTVQWIRQQVADTSVTATAEIDAVKAAERTLAMVAAFYPGRARCLEQSLALYYLLRRKGVAVRYCQGVQPYPFQAHAWIEYRGDVINDIAEHVSQFSRLPDQLP